MTSRPAVSVAPPSEVDVLERFQHLRSCSERFASHLEPEDCVIQSMPDVSPTRWHLAHSTWFFETFVLRPLDGREPFDAQYEYLFNSYYNAVGQQFDRARRGLLSRPTLREVMDYRAHVNDAITRLLAQEDVDSDVLSVIELGLNHEQQHLELMHTDIKHVLSVNPLRPVFRSPREREPGSSRPLTWIEHGDGLHWIGHGGVGFAFDNEGPRHRVFLERFSIADRLTTNGEFMEFIEDRGYERPELWLSAGWNRVREENWSQPLYWANENGQRTIFTLEGQQPLRLEDPVCHVSFFEADAFARWSGARLALEAEWEVAVENVPVAGNLLEKQQLKPTPAGPHTSWPAQVFGDVWEWTASPYSPYPGYAPEPGALGEYNGKFMCNQLVLRGGSCVTPGSHIRATYRNFMPPEARWQFAGIRLAK